MSNLYSSLFEEYEAGMSTYCISKLNVLLESAWLES